MTTITIKLTNDFHGTQTTMRVPSEFVLKCKNWGQLDWTSLALASDDGIISARALDRAADRLCGISDCKCTPASRVETR